MRLTWQCSLGREWQIVRVQVAVGYNSMAGSSVSASFTRAREKPKYKLFKAKRCTSLSVLDSAFVSARVYFRVYFRSLTLSNDLRIQIRFDLRLPVDL